MNDLTCPYCGADNEVCHDDGFGYAENVRHETECHACGKNFVFTTSIVLYYTAAKADCLNGDKHELCLSNTYPVQYSRWVCRCCDYERRLSADEIALAKTDRAALAAKEVG